MDSVARELDTWLRQMPKVDRDVEAARQRIGRLSRLLTRVLALVADEQGVSVSDLETLSVVRRNGDSAAPGRIAAELRLTAGSVSTRLRRLEIAGLAMVTASDVYDGRTRTVRLTDAGLRAWRRGTQQRVDNEAVLFAVLDRSALVGLNDALATLLARVEHEFGDASRHDHN